MNNLQMFPAKTHAKEIFQTSEAKLQAENDKSRKELEDERCKGKSG